MLPTRNTVVELRSFAPVPACALCSAVAIGGEYHDTGRRRIRVSSSSGHRGEAALEVAHSPQGMKDHSPLADYSPVTLSENVPGGVARLVVTDWRGMGPFCGSQTRQ